MRFVSAWSDVLNQNITLRVVILALTICLAVVSILAAHEGLKDPIVVERSCFTQIAKTGSSQHTKEEIEAFVKIALSQRFDTSVNASPEVLSVEEIGFRKQEQQDLASKTMIQRIIVNSVQISGNEVKIDSDRLISVGQIRSALAFPITVTITSVSRTESNPYGLLMARVGPASKKEGEQ